MTRQEFAAAVEAVRTGRPGAMLELWQGVRGFVASYAFKWERGFGERVTRDDLMQAGFLAVADAVEIYDAERENGSFLSVLCFMLRERFAKECGVRTTKRDALQFAESAESTAYGDENAPTIADTIPDAKASLAFTGVEYRDFMPYCRGVIKAAFETLSESQADILRLRYLDGLTLEEIAKTHGISSKQATDEAEKRALDRLARGKYRQALRECLDTLADLRAGMDAERADLWSASRTEKAALRRIAKEGESA